MVYPEYQSKAIDALYALYLALYNSDPPKNVHKRKPNHQTRNPNPSNSRHPRRSRQIRTVFPRGLARLPVDRPVITDRDLRDEPRILDTLRVSRRAWRNRRISIRIAIRRPPRHRARQEVRDDEAVVRGAVEHLVGPAR